MGKKSRVKTQKSGTGATAAVSPKEMMNLISELLQSEYKAFFMAAFLFWYTVAMNNSHEEQHCASLVHKKAFVIMP